MDMILESSTSGAVYGGAPGSWTRPAAPSSLSQQVGSGLAPWQAKKVAAYIETRFEEAIRVEDLAGLLHFSRSYFSRAFKASFGVSPHQFITARRVANAMQTMTCTQTPLCEIALMCGFSDQAHMSRVFRRIAGCPPHLWRQRRRAALLTGDVASLR